MKFGITMIKIGNLFLWMKADLATIIFNFPKQICGEGYGESVPPMSFNTSQRILHTGLLFTMGLFVSCTFIGYQRAGLANSAISEI
jgi:hypothetical protein